MEALFMSFRFSLLYKILEENIMRKTSLKNTNYPIIHEKIFHNESSYQRLQRSSKLIRRKESNVANGDQWRYEMFQVAGIQALMQRLKMGKGRYNQHYKYANKLLTDFIFKLKTHENFNSHT